MCKKKKCLKPFSNHMHLGKDLLTFLWAVPTPDFSSGQKLPWTEPPLLGNTIPIFQCRSKIIQQVAMELHKHSCSRNQRLPISHKHPLTTPDSEQTSPTGGEFSGHAIQMIHFQYLLLLYQFFWAICWNFRQKEKF